MGNIVLNVAKGATKHYASLPGTNDALLLVPLESADLVADSTMKDYDTLAAVLAGASNEQTTIGRKTLGASDLAVTVNDTDDRLEIHLETEQTWAAATGNQVGALLLCYDPDTTGGSDADLVPMAKFDWTMTPEGADLVLPAGELLRTTDPA